MASKKKKLAPPAVIEEPVFSDMGERLLGPHIDVQVLANELNSIPDLTAKSVVEVARNPRSKLHPLFEWDDAKAAQKQREDRARFIIACIHFRRSDADEDTSAPRMLYNVRGQHGREYIHLETIRSNFGYQVRLLEQAEGELQMMETRFSHIAVICEAVSEAKAKVAAARAAAGPGGGGRRPPH